MLVCCGVIVVVYDDVKTYLATYMHTCSHTYIHTYIHTYMHAFMVYFLVVVCDDVIDDVVHDDDGYDVAVFGAVMVGTYLQTVRKQILKANRKTSLQLDQNFLSVKIVLDL